MLCHFRQLILVYFTVFPVSEKRFITFSVTRAFVLKTFDRSSLQVMAIVIELQRTRFDSQARL